MVIACCGVVIAQMALSILSPLLGDIQRAYHANGSQLNWVSDAFLLPGAVLELSFGVVGDLFGRKRILVSGGALMLIGALIAFLSRTVPFIILGQAIMGLSAAALYPSALAMISAATPSSVPRSRGLAMWTLAMGVGSVAGPLLGGFIGDYADFRVAFAILAGLGLLFMIVAQTLATDSSAPEGRGLDWAGQGTIAVALFAVIYGIIQGPVRGWSSALIIICFVVAAVAFGMFLVAESRTRSPILRLELFRIPAFRGMAAVAVIGGFAFLGAGYSFTIRVSAIQRQSPLHAGLMTGVMFQVVAIILFPVLAVVIRRVSARWILAFGMACFAIGQFWIASMPIGTASIASAIGPDIILGLGFTCLMTGLVAAAMNAVPVHLAGMAAGATNLLRDLGTTFAPAILGTVAIASATRNITGTLAHTNLTPAAHHIAGGVMGEGGPLALLNAPLGPLSKTVSPIAEHGLWHGYSLVMVISAIAAVVAGIIAVTVLRDRPGHVVQTEEEMRAMEVGVGTVS